MHCFSKAAAEGLFHSSMSKFTEQLNFLNLNGLENN